MQLSAPPWAPRPPVQILNEHLEDFFPEHDPSTLRTNNQPANCSSNWILGELIGRGSFGRVYVGMNATREIIAVKQILIPEDVGQSTEKWSIIQAFEKDDDLLKSLNHPHIVQYLGMEEAGDVFNLFMEYVPGGSIGSLIRRHGKLPEDITKSFLAQILDGLNYLHSKGIIHRSIKADNILLGQNGVCQISDFAPLKQNLGPGNTSLQTAIFWIAPEVLFTPTDYDSKVDIWGVGCVALEMWTGNRPWHGEDLGSAMISLHQRRIPPIPEEVELPELAEGFRSKCFTVNPDERLSATELRNHRYLELEPGWVFDIERFNNGGMLYN